MSNQHWPLVPLVDVLTRNDKLVTLLPAQQYRDVTIRLWGKGVVLRQIIYGADITSQRRSQVSQEQFILSRIYARNGAMGLVPTELDGAVVTNDFPTFNVNRERLLPAFLGWLCRTSAFVDTCRSASEGTTNRVRLKEERFMKQEIRLPTVKEQQRIVGRIVSLFGKIEEVSELRHQINVKLTALKASLHFALSKGRQVQMDRLVVLEEVRVTVSPTEFYPQIGIRGFGGELFAKPALPGSETQYRHFNRLSTGHLVLSQVKGWEGAIAVCTSEFDGFFASPEYRTFRCIEENCDPEYLDVLVRSSWFRKLLQNATHGQGARRERTRPEQFAELVLSMPEIEDQQKAVRMLRSLNRIDAFAPHLTATNNAMLPSILDSAFEKPLRNQNGMTNDRVRYNRYALPTLGDDLTDGSRIQYGKMAQHVETD